MDYTLIEKLLVCAMAMIKMGYMLIVGGIGLIILCNILRLLCGDKIEKIFRALMQF